MQPQSHRLLFPFQGQATPPLDIFRGLLFQVWKSGFEAYKKLSFL